jgi:hypothetical protein
MGDETPVEKLPVVVRAEGVTPAERYLQRLCEHSFLSLWSYPSLYRDQKVGSKGDGKELCDLLVVFGDDILIFSDKCCAFPNTGDVGLDWCRWFRKAVMESAKQAWGAERWLREHPDRIFIDRGCTERFPLDLPLAERMRVHHIIVAHNVADRCRAYFGGRSSGTLMFTSDLIGKDHYGDPSTCQPFTVGWLDTGRNFVHVLDDASLHILLTARDTITDFVAYLRAKEELLSDFRARGIVFSYAGEEDLLANYLLTMKGDGHGFSFPNGYDSIALDEGDWVEFQSSPQRAAQIAADRISYSWDALIQKFNENILGGTSHFTTNPRIAEREKTMRFFAREPRVQRRMLADALLSFMETTGQQQRGTRIMQPSYPGDPHYCFLLLPKGQGQSEEQYREFRRGFLGILCQVTKVVCPEALDIVGLATETNIASDTRSEDALYFDARNWNEELEAQARKWQQEHKLLVNLSKFEGKVSEFPVPAGLRITAPGP